MHIEDQLMNGALDRSFKKLSGGIGAFLTWGCCVSSEWLEKYLARLLTPQVGQDRR